MKVVACLLEAGYCLQGIRLRNAVQLLVRGHEGETQVCHSRVRTALLKIRDMVFRLFQASGGGNEVVVLRVLDDAERI